MHAADTKANSIAWYKEVIGFTDTVAKALYKEQLLEDKKTLAKLSDSKIDSVMRAFAGPNPLPKYLRHDLSLPYSGSSTKTAPSGRLAYQPILLLE